MGAITNRAFGRRVLRNEDVTLLQGEGRFVDDFELRDALHVAFVRSPMARGRIRSIDTSVAVALPGVVDVVSCDDLGDLDCELPLLRPHPALTHPRTQRPLARDDVFYAGQTVVMVMAVDRYTAEDAAESVDVAYDPLLVAVDVEAAAGPDAPLVHADVPGNVAAHCVQTHGDVDDVFANADHVTRVRVRVDRSTAAPLETRAVAAQWDPGARELTVWDTTQAPLLIRGGLANLFGLDEERVRVIAPHVGGGFGQKVMLFYPEEVLVPWAAIRYGRAVKYVEDRRENFLGSNHERAQVHELELATTREGVVIGLRDSFLHDTGAFIPYGLDVPVVAAAQIAGPYRIPNVWVEFKAIYTPTVPVSPYRGCGRPHACFAIERAMDRLADELKLDRFEVRRRNLIQPDEFPYERPGLIFADDLPVSYDSGDYPRALDLLRDAVNPDDFARQQEQARQEGRYVGLGVALYVEGTGLGPYEGAHVRVDTTSGKVYVRTGLTSQGQGHLTTFAQITADQLSVSPEDVVVVQGDTKSMARGVGTYASRAAVVSGNAVHGAARQVREQALQAAARLLEAAQEDLEMGEGRVWVRGAPSRSVTLAEVARSRDPVEHAFAEGRPGSDSGAGQRPLFGWHPGLEATEHYSPPSSTWAYGAHAAIVEVDVETCTLSIKRYICVHDCGRMINPTIVEGQILGGIAQGLGGAFYEYLDYDELGNLRNPNFMDFLMPYATEVPQTEFVHLETPSARNPLGIKGVGEAGTIPVAAVIAAAVEDALRPLGAGSFLRAPLSPNAIHESLSAGRAMKP